MDIFENDGKTPVVQHIFNADTEKEAAHYLASHKKTDKFLKAAIDDGEFEGIKLKVKRRTIEHTK